jgi:Domain of unknown function (DUF4926)
MRFRELETVVLERDIPERGLRKGDLGAVVELYDPDGLEVEFVRASGKTQALVELKTSDVRSVCDEDLVSVRSIARGAA